MRKYVVIDDVPPFEQVGECGGRGAIIIRRLLGPEQFKSDIDFIDFKIVPPGSTIGRHYDHGSEKAYIITKGQPLMRIDGEMMRVAAGFVAVVRAHEWHELINDTGENVYIFVIQVSLSEM